MARRLLDQVGQRSRGGIVQLDPKDAFGGDLVDADTPAEVVPRVEHQSAVRAPRVSDHPHRLAHAADLGPRQELEGHEQVVRLCAVAQTREALDDLLVRNLCVRHEHCVDRAPADGVGDGEELLLAVGEEAAPLLVRSRREIGRRHPVHQRVDLGDSETVVVEERAQIGVRQAVGAGPVVVVGEDRDSRVARRRRRLHPLLQAGRRNGSGTQHQVVESQLTHANLLW